MATDNAPAARPRQGQRRVGGGSLREALSSLKATRARRDRAQIQPPQPKCYRKGQLHLRWRGVTGRKSASFYTRRLNTAAGEVRAQGVAWRGSRQPRSFSCGILRTAWGQPRSLNEGEPAAQATGTAPAGKARDPHEGSTATELAEGEDAPGRPEVFGWTSTRWRWSCEVRPLAQQHLPRPKWPAFIVVQPTTVCWATPDRCRRHDLSAEPAWPTRTLAAQAPRRPLARARPGGTRPGMAELQRMGSLPAARSRAWPPMAQTVIKELETRGYRGCKRWNKAFVGEVFTEAQIFPTACGFSKLTAH